MVQCPLCNNRVESFHPRSHLVSEWMYTECYDEKHKVLEIQPANRKILKKQKGIRESFICSACEEKTQKFDHYASLILTERSPNSPEYIGINRKSFESWHDGELVKYFKWGKINFDKLQKFILVTILRTHYSGRMQGKITLTERHESRILKIYQDKNSKDDSSYPILLWKYPEGDFLNNHVVLPYIRKISGHHVIEFSGAGYMFHVYVSNHTKPKYTQSLRLKNDGSMYITDIEFKQSGLYKSLQKVAKEIDLTN